MLTRSISRATHKVCAAAGLLGTLSAPAQAVTVVWDGGGISTNWSSVNTTAGPSFGRTNWSGAFILPTDGADLVFAGSRRTTNVNDLSMLATVRSIRFDEGAGAFTLTGRPLTVTGNIVNESSQRQRIRMPISAGGPATWNGGTAGLEVTTAMGVLHSSLVLESGAVAIDHRPGGPEFAINSTLILRDGGQFDTWASLVLGRNTGTAGTISVQGADARFDATNPPIVGQSGMGVVFVTGGATFSTTSQLYVALESGSSGTLSAMGAGSTIQITEQGLMLGGSGQSSLSLLGGAALSSFEDVELAQRAPSRAVATVSSGALLESKTGSIVVGIFGEAQMNITSGGVVSAALNGVVASASGGRANVEVSGNSSAWRIGRQLIVGISGNGRLDILDSGSVKSVDAKLGIGAAGVGAVRVSGTGSTWSQAGELLVGDGGTGSVLIDSGGRVFSGSASVAEQPSSQGDVIVRGAGSAWAVAGDLAIGGSGTASLLIEDGATTSVGGTLAIGSRGVLRLAGGSLEVNALGPGGRIEWSGGLLHVKGSSGVTLGRELPAVLVLSSSQRLQVDQALGVGAGTALVLAGGEVIGNRLELSGGSVLVTTGGLDMTSFATLAGAGTVAARVTGGAGRSIVAGGTLTLGNAGDDAGFLFDGTLDVGSNHVILLSAGLARPGAVVTLGASGRLSTINGAQLGSGGQLGFSGDARLDGAFVNDGHVAGAGGVLTFTGDVSGRGSYAGDILFRAGFAPGSSPATIDFGGGDATFDRHSILTLAFVSPDPTAGYDRLDGIGHLSFSGLLRLVFDPQFDAASASTLFLLGFDSFSGALSPDRIEVVGLDRDRLDFSSLALTGTIGVIPVPVPEPGAALLLLAGGVLVAWRHRVAAGATAPGRC